MKRLLATALIWLSAATYAAAQIVTGSVPNTFVNGTVIDATQVNADYAYIISQVNANGAKNGTNSDITALTSLGTPIPVAAGGATNYIATTVGGTGNAITVTATTPAISSYSYTYGFGITLRPTASNTAATTINVNGIGVKNIYKPTSTGAIALTGGELIAGQWYTLFYDGTEYVLTATSDAGLGFGPVKNIAGGATVDLSTISSRNANVTGTTFTVTSLGAPAYPSVFYMVAWSNSGAVAQTASASLVLLNGVASKSVFSGDRQLFLWDGSAWTEIAYFPANAKGTRSGATGVLITNNAGTPNSKIDVTATESILVNTSNAPLYVANYGTCTIDLSVNGANGLDTGTRGNYTWYYVYLISNGSTNGCLGSASSSAPTMPSGYTFKVRLGAMRTDGSAVLYRTKQMGNIAQYTLVAATNTATYSYIFSGAGGSCSSGTSTWAATSVRGGVVPTTAISINVHIASYGSPVAAGVNNVPASYGDQPMAASTTSASTAMLELESSGNIWYCSNGVDPVINAVGWIDQVNAH